MNLTIDLESVPCQWPGILKEFADAVQPPATYKKPESIAAWLEENRAAEAEGQWLKTSFDGGMGQIVCIGYAFDDGAVNALSVPSLSVADESSLLQCFFADLQKAYSGTSGTRPLVIGFNHVAFDLPFVMKRSVVHGIKPPHWWPRNVKPWSDSVYDCMTEWSGVKDRISMDRLCRVLGIPGKGDGPTGADVWPMVRDGKIDEVAEYCRADVQRTRAIYKRMTFA